MTHRYSEYERGWQRGYRIGLDAGTSVNAGVLRAKNEVIMALTGIEQRQRKEIAALTNDVSAKDRVLVELQTLVRSQSARIAELQQVNAVLQQNVDELAARMPSKPERRSPYDFQVGDLVRHREYRGKDYRIAAINPATHRAMFEGCENSGWFPLSHYFRVEA